MNAPDRSAEVTAIVNQHRDLFGTDDSRRPILWYVCQALNALDDNNWGIVVKSDQGGFIPSDIICWAPTTEHFDVLKGAPDGPSWQPRGPLPNPAWHWASADLVKPANLPAAPTQPPAPNPPIPFPRPAPPVGELAPEDLELLLEKVVDPIVAVVGELASSIIDTGDRLTRREDGALSEFTQAVSNLSHQIELLRTEGVRVRLR